jgi:hypothetical protein
VKTGGVSFQHLHPKLTKRHHPEAVIIIAVQYSAGE